MDSRGYLKAYGWKEGEGLKPGALKRPILVKHKNDKKGLGSAPGGDDGEMWWETLFDGHLKNLNVKDGGKGGDIKFEQKDIPNSAVVKDKSPLYRWFVKGEGLKGTIETDLLISKTRIEEKAEVKKCERKKDERSSKKSSKKSDHKKDRKNGKISKKKTKKQDKKSSKSRSDKKDKKDKKERKEKKRSSKKDQKKLKDGREPS
ncbi:Tma23p LALA0_S06e05380g [Lachancea lanzarotensis]|uniref:LALA0S06e05380g1_1 n=1 Tax=Lachancea lanzarotensis TaxID=1245769 RepID=A0A0C7MSC1_9SACH|nr:uncharacterized protein LALA0_S06e05380g [Lachancea lanzarotensis]CEP62855.1 LALA0S06e05380g1_1 [Lachancea lanzarotensis]